MINASGTKYNGALVVRGCVVFSAFHWSVFLLFFPAQPELHCSGWREKTELNVSSLQLFICSVECFSQIWTSGRLRGDFLTCSRHVPARHRWRLVGRCRFALWAVKPNQLLCLKAAAVFGRRAGYQLKLLSGAEWDYVERPSGSVSGSLLHLETWSRTMTWYWALCTSALSFFCAHSRRVWQSAPCSLMWFSLYVKVHLLSGRSCRTCWISNVITELAFK